MEAGRDLPGAAPEDAGARRRWFTAAILLVVVFVVDEASPLGMTADSMRAVAVAVAIVHFHTIGLDHFRLLFPKTHFYGLSTVGHHVYPLFPWGDSLFAVPWVVAYDVAHKLGVGEGSVAMVNSTHDWPLQVVSMSAVVAVTTVVVYFIALRALTIRPAARRSRWAAGVALAFAFATPAWSTASRSLWQHGPSILCLSIALLCALRARDGLRGWTGMGLALGFAYMMRPTDALVVAILGLWVLLAHPRQALRVIAGGAVPAAILVGVDLVAYHQVLTPYFTEGQGFAVSGTMATALAGNLISPARGLLLFCPLVLLSAAGVVLRRRGGGLDGFWVALTAIPVAHWVVISAFKHWWAGDTYGPRLFTDMLPLLVVLALPAVDWLAGVRRARRLGAHGAARSRLGGEGHRPGTRPVLIGLCGLALVWSLFVEVQGATLRSAWCWNNEPTDVDAHPSKLWAWSDPQFLRGVRQVVSGPRYHELTRDSVDLYGCPTEPLG